MDTTQDLVELFRRQVLATPDAVAAVDDTASWTYAELDKATDYVARRLRSVYGVGRDVLVGVLMGHNIQYIVACLAVLKAGGAFLVLEVAYPPGLLADVIEDARPPVILTSADYAERVPAHTPRILLERGMTVADLAALPTADPLASFAGLPDALPQPTDLDRLAFVSYSSGTTGRPKGICNPHSAPVQSYAMRFQISDLRHGDRVACNVFFVWEILRPLLKGAAVVTVPDDASYDPVGLVKFLAHHEITETLMTPTLLATVLARYPDLATRLPRLRTLWLNGEVVSVDLARRATAALSPPGAAPVRLLNCYSVSETHEIACGDIREALEHLPADATVCPVGPPMDPEHTYVLDEDGNLLPPGVGGELYVGGPLLARGYLNRPETTAEVFLPNRFNGGVGRMYRTGDKARLLPSTGELEISGRVGGMIKVRGYTVHPAAVESAIVKHLAVRSCVVLADKEGLERQLVAYVVRDVEGGAASGPDLRAPLQINGDGHSPLARRLLADHLAHYMIPVFWVELDTLPTHKVSGKVDVNGLPSLRAGPSPPETPPADSLAQILWGNGAAAVAPGGVQNDPATQIDENDVRRHWAACLNLPETSVDPQQFDFFDLGGHSLALAQLSSRLSAAYGVNVPLLALASDPTMAGHIAAVAAAARAASSAAAQSVDNSLLKAMIEADSVLPDDLAIAATSETTSPARISDATDIFLTGATGFLGAFLLVELVATTTATIHCLVRGSPASSSSHSKPGSGMARLRKHLLGLGLWTDSIVDRIEIVTGDLALPSLGLGAKQFADLAARIQAIVHAGAHVNLVYPYDALRDANVGGTKEVLRLAAQGPSTTTVHYISTNGVLPPAKHAWNEDDAPVSTAADVVDKISDGYGQTKWAAEQLVRAAAQKGLSARIYRPGTLGGHSQTGATNPRDVVTALLVESLRIGYSPNVDGWRIEMTPVDAAASKILRLADAAATTDNSVLHIGDVAAVLAKDVFARLALLGYETQPVDWDEWVARWNEDQSDAPPAAAATAARDDSDLSPMDILRAGMPSADFLKLVILLDDTKTNALLGDSETQPHLPLDLDLLATYARHFYSRGWLHKGPSKNKIKHTVAESVVPVPKGPLAGRVAVVVGASSGIGAAIATALANDGAHIALGARRIGELKTLQAALEAQFPGTKVLPQATDVTDAAQVKALVDAATAQLGPIDILVVCAGVMYFTMMSSVRADEWDRTVDVNCKGLLHCLSAALPGMLARAKPLNGASAGSGASPHIVAISSDAGRKVFPGLGVYSGSKFFVEAVLQALRVETAGTGLRVTSVQPGNTATELLGLSTDPEAMEKFGAPTGAQVLSPADVASAVVYAVRQPAHVAVNEVMIEPRDEPI